MNKKHLFLDEPEWLKEERYKKSRSQLAKELSDKTGVKKSIIEGCLRYRELKWYPKEVIKKFKQERIYHTNKKKSKV